MSMQLLYQNNRSGEILDVTRLVTDPAWSTKRTGTPASLDFTALPGTVDWQLGGILSLRIDGVGIFYGFVFGVETDHRGMVSIRAYDQTRYLKNKATYVIEGKRADQLLTQIAAEYKLTAGVLANTGYVIPSMTEDNKTLFDIVLKALDLTLVNTGKLFYLWDDFGALRISAVEDSKLDLVLGDNSLVTGYSYAEDIDGETYNRIKLTRDNDTTGRRDVWMYEDTASIGLWGVLQRVEKVDENMNAAQISEQGATMLELYNRPARSFDLTGISDLRVRAGVGVFVHVSSLGVSKYFIVDEAKHSLAKGQMTVKLRVV